MKNLALRLGVSAVILFLAPAAWAQKVSALPNTGTPLPANSLFSVAVGGTVTESRSFGQLAAQLTTSNITGSAAAAFDLSRTTNGPISGTDNEYRMRVPPRVWGTWNDFPTPMGTGWSSSTNVGEVYIRTLCDWWATNGMRDAGFKYIVLEENWQTGLDANGRFIVNTAADKFPSGLTNLFSYIKAKGFIPGIYTSVDANHGTITCESFAGTCYTNLDKHFQQFADWGVEFVFVDACTDYSDWTDVPNQSTTGSDNRYRQRIQLINAAIAKTGKRIAWLNTTPNDYTRNGFFTPDSYSQQNITFSKPFTFTDRWDFVPTFDQTQIALRTYTNSLNGWNSYTRPGHYFYQGQINNSPGTWPDNTYKFAFCLQSMAGGAIFIDSGQHHIYSEAAHGHSGDSLTNTYPYLGPWANPPTTWFSGFPMQLQTNQEIAAIHQDPAVVPAKLVYSNNLAEIWWKPLGKESLASEHALLVANLGPTDQTIPVPFSLFASTNAAFVLRDVVFQTNFPIGYTNTVSLTITPTNSYLLRLSPVPPVVTVALPGHVVTNNLSSTNLAVGSNIIANLYGTQVTLGGVAGYESTYSGIWFQLNAYGAQDFNHMALGGTGGDTVWVGSTAQGSLRVNNLHVFDWTSGGVTTTGTNASSGKITGPSLTASNFVAWQTNYAAANFAVIPTQSKLVVSNNYLYFVTQTKTNLVINGN